MVKIYSLSISIIFLLFLSLMPFDKNINSEFQSNASSQNIYNYFSDLCVLTKNNEKLSIGFFGSNEVYDTCPEDKLNSVGKKNKSNQMGDENKTSHKIILWNLKPPISNGFMSIEDKIDGVSVEYFIKRNSKGTATLKISVHNYRHITKVNVMMSITNDKNIPFYFRPLYMLGIIYQEHYIKKEIKTWVEQSLLLIEKNNLS